MSFLVSIATGIFTDIVNWGKEKVVKHFFYMLDMDDTVTVLKREMEELGRLRDDVDVEITEKKRQGMVPYKAAEGWLKDVNDIQGRVVEILSLHDKAKPNCKGCSMNCISNYSIGKKAAELHPEVAKLKQNKKDLGEVVTEKPLPSVQVMPTSINSTAAAVLEACLQDALCFLRDNKEGRLGIWGVEGVGKSTLLKSINNAMKGRAAPRSS